MEELRKYLDRNGRTPKMWLKEICDKEGIALPLFATKNMTLAPPLFKAVVELKNFGGKEYVGEGFDGNKKSAEHAAATSLLFKMGITPKDLEEIPKRNNGRSSAAVNEVGEGGHSGMPDLIPQQEKNVPLVMQEEKPQEPISVLSCSELCDLISKRSNLHPPQYQEIGESGPDHCKKFRIQCRVDILNGISLTIVAEDSTKKRAKNRAAALMIQKILEEFPISLQTKDDEGLASLASQNEKQVRDDTTPKITCRDRMRCKELLAHDHHRFQRLIGPMVFNLHKMSLAEDELNPIGHLSSLAADQELQVNYTIFPLPGMNGKVQGFCEISYPRNVGGQSTVHMGEGETREDAYSSAAKKALTFLQEVTGP